MLIKTATEELKEALKERDVLARAYEKVCALAGIPLEKALQIIAESEEEV